VSGVFPAAPFATTGLISEHRTLVSVAQSGRRQARKVGGHRWRFTAKFAPMTREEFAPILAFVVAQEGAFGTFEIVLPELATPRGVATGAPIYITSLVVDGGFSTGLYWALGPGWSIGSGAATRTNVGVASDCYQAQTLLAGVTYAVTFSITAYTSGQIRPAFTGVTGVTGTFCAGVGTYVEQLTPTTDELTLTFQADAAFAGSIDGVVVTPVDADVAYADNFTPGTAGIMKAGDVVRFAGHSKVYMLRADADSDAWGHAALQIVPPLIHTPANGEALTVTNVPFTVALDGDVVQYRASRPSLFQFEMDLVEAY